MPWQPYQCVEPHVCYYRTAICFHSPLTMLVVIPNDIDGRERRVRQQHVIAKIAMIER